MENPVHTTEPEAGRIEHSRSDDWWRARRQATADGRQATGDARLRLPTECNAHTSTNADVPTDDGPTNEPTNYPVTEYATKKAHLLERWLAEGSRGDCTQGSAEKGVKRRDGEGMEDGRSVRERGSWCWRERRGGKGQTRRMGIEKEGRRVGRRQACRIRKLRRTWNREKGRKRNGRADDKDGKVDTERESTLR